MRYLVYSLLLISPLILVSCTSKDISKLTEATLVATGTDPDSAKRQADSVGKIAKSQEPVSLDKEMEIGGGIAVKSFSVQGTLHPDTELQRYIAKVGLAIVAQTERADFPFAFAVVENEDINAWAAPGGYVFITTGALSQMENEAQLAGVLAHEIGHVVRGHMIEMIRRQQLQAGAAGLAQSSLSGDMAQFSAFVDQGTGILFEKGLDQNMEYDADKVGMEFAALTGYNPAELIVYLEKLASVVENEGGGWLKSTHPSLSSRVQKLKAIEAQDFEGIGGAIVEDRFKRIVGAAVQLQ